MEEVNLAIRSDTFEERLVHDLSVDRDRETALQMIAQSGEAGLERTEELPDVARLDLDLLDPARVHLKRFREENRRQLYSLDCSPSRTRGGDIGSR